MPSDPAKQTLHPIEASHLHARRERVFLVLAGLFLGSMTMLNILGTSRFIDMSFTVGDLKIPFALAVGVLPYPITFLCTDFISELYGRQRANFLVWVGFFLNVWVLFILWIAGVLPPMPEMDPQSGLPATSDYAFAFYRVRQLTMGAVVASMAAYLAAQFCDVYLFHFWKRLTKGKHLWLRNNGSTIFSQLVDTSMVLALLSVAGAIEWSRFWTLLGSGFLFKVLVALADTPLLYLSVALLRRRMGLQPAEEVAGVERLA